MKENQIYQGRSLVFNAIFIILNLTGLTFLVLGYHDNFQDNATLFLTIALILMISTIGGLIVFKGKMMMASVARILVGGLFIVSGLVKANDPLGFAYKLEEYFEDGALAFRIKEWFSAPEFSMEFFIDYAVLLSVLICIAEIVLGVLTIIGGKIKLVSYLMLFMMIFFTFLTWHTASCDNTVKFLDRDTYAMSDPIAQMKIEDAKTNEEITIVSQSSTKLVVDEMKLPQCVDDCGCFGDAMKGSVGRSMTPKESLWKDIVLVYLVLWIFVSQRKIKPNNRKENLIFVTASIMVIVFFSWVFGWYFPIFFGIASILAAIWMLRAGGKFLGNHYGSAIIVTILCMLMVGYVLRYAPMKDYRPYAIGADLKVNMNDGVDGKYATFYFLTDLEVDTMARVDLEAIPQEVWSNTKKWKAVFDTTEEILATKNPSIMDFNPFVSLEDMTDDERESPLVKQILDTSSIQLLKILDIGYNSTMEIPFEEYSIEGFPVEEYTILDTIVALNPEITDVSITKAILAQDKIVILVSKKFGTAVWSDIQNIKEIYEECVKNNVPFVFICNASREEINNFKKENDIHFPTFVMDEIELKVVSRSNPALLVIEKGVVKAKYSYRSFPKSEKFTKIYLK